MFGNSRLDSEALDRHITGNYGEDFLNPQAWDEYDPPCKNCGKLSSDHPVVHREDEEGNDYDLVVCPDDA